MAGFTAIIKRNGEFNKSFSIREKNRYGNEENYLLRSSLSASYHIEQFTNRKFPDDKILVEDENYIVGIEGVILNLHQLRQQTKYSSLFDVVKALFEQYGDAFIKKLKGEFSGFIYIKRIGKWLIFNNITGSKRIFYYAGEDYFLFASNLRDITSILRRLDIPFTPDTDAAYLLLTCGYMLDDRTLIHEVKTLEPGNYLVYENGNAAVSEYFNLRNIPHTTDSKKVIIKKMDELFSEAVRLQFDKDLEYGYRHYATLSGGLDSRMTSLVAHHLGYRDQVNFTFSQTGWLDHTIAQQIAADYHHEFLFHSLDFGNFLTDIDRIVFYNDGLIIYSGAAHMLRSLEKMGFGSYGLLHTGQIGDAVIGSFLSKPYPVPPETGAGFLSKKLIQRIEPLLLQIRNRFPTEELFKFYGRGFAGALNGNVYIDIYSHTASPFLDTDFLSYCYSIPEKYKYKQAIYLEWVKMKYPWIAKYKWEKTGVAVSASGGFVKYLKPGYYKRMSNKLSDRLTGKIRSGMNPFSLWLRENDLLEKTLADYYSSHIHLLSGHQQLYDDCKWLFQHGTPNEKFQVITLLAAFKLHF